MAAAEAAENKLGLELVAPAEHIPVGFPTPPVSGASCSRPVALLFPLPHVILAVNQWGGGAYRQVIIAPSRGRAVGK